jgi:hypothetical protein
VLVTHATAAQSRCGRWIIRPGPGNAVSYLGDQEAGSAPYNYCMKRKSSESC